jgi:hypothetical protein
MLDTGRDEKFSARGLAGGHGISKSKSGIAEVSAVVVQAPGDVSAMFGRNVIQHQLQHRARMNGPTRHANDAATGCGPRRTAAIRIMGQLQVQCQPTLCCGVINVHRFSGWWGA